MANIKFSAFTNQAAADTTYLVGYDGTDNTNYDKAQVKNWLNIGTNRIPTLYNTSASLGEDRSVTLAGFDLTFVATSTGKIIYTDGNQATGYVLKSDANGKASWGAETDTDTGITSVTYVIGAGQTTPLTGVITSRALELTSNKYGGTNQVGYVPQGGTGTTFLRGDGTWVTPTDSTDNAAGTAGQLQYTTGSGVFAATSDMVYTNDQLKVQNTLYLDGNNANAGIVKLGCEAAGASHYVGLEGPTHGGANAYIIKFPDATPTANQILKVNTVVSSTANMVWAADTDTNTNIANTNLNLDASRTLGLGADQNLTFTGSGTSKVTFSNLGGVEIARDLTVQKNVIIQGQGYSELHTGVTTATFDWNAGNVQSTTLGAVTVAFAPTNPKAGATYIISIAQTGTAVINWSTYVKWPSTGEPTLSGNAKTDVVTLICYDDSVGDDRYYGSATLGFTS